jgi:hypothetical protein
MLAYLAELLACVLLVALGLAFFAAAGGQRDREAMVLVALVGVAWLVSIAWRAVRDMRRGPH